MELKENTYVSRGKKYVLKYQHICWCMVVTIWTIIFYVLVYNLRRNKHEMIGKEKRDIVGEEM